jgi:4-hydroxy-tetrahydrodipicolinate synthase
VSPTGDAAGTRTPSAPLARGVWVILATPFERPGGDVDHASLARQVELAPAIGARGVVALGVFGESARLDDAERRAVVTTVVRALAPHANTGLVVGLSTLGTDETIDQAHDLLEAARAGGAAVRAVMLQVPTAEPDALITHLAAVHAATGVDQVVQDYPLVSGVQVRAEDLAHAVAACPWVVAVKAEAPPTPPAIATLVAGTDVPVFGGLGGVGLLDELAVGSAGAMTGFSQPEALIATVDAFERAGFAAAHAEWSRWLPLATFEQQAGIALAIRKELLRRRGLIADASVRAPGAALPVSLVDGLEAHLAALGLPLAPPARSDAASDAGSDAGPR